MNISIKFSALMVSIILAIGSGTNVMTQSSVVGWGGYFSSTGQISIPVGLNGSCTIGSGPRTSSDPALNGINRKSTISTQTASQTVTWTGTIPGNGSVTITHLVQVSAQARSGQYCVTTTINGVAGSPACLGGLIDIIIGGLIDIIR